MMEGQRMRMRTHQHMQQQKQQQAMFVQPKQQQFLQQAVDIKKDSEKLQNDQERLSSLHSKLHKEAEKIRQWKGEKEMELKQKERSLSDAIQTIESLRKSILELQVQNESYSTELHQTELEKEETEQKINTVKEMANLLRDQMVQLEERIAKGEQDKEYITQANQKVFEENQSLLLKFQELDICQATMLEKHSTNVHTMESAHDEKVKDMESNIRHLENQIVTLIEVKSNQEQLIADYSTKVEENEQNLINLHSQLANTTNKLQQAEQVLSTQEKSLSETTSALNDVSTKYDVCSEKIKETESMYETLGKEFQVRESHNKEVEEIYKNEINSLQNDLKEANATLAELQLERESLNKNIEEQKDLISAYEEEKTNQNVTCEELNAKLCEQTSIIADLESVKQECDKQIEDSRIRIAEIEDKLSSMCEVNASLTKSVNELSENVQNLDAKRKALEEEARQYSKDLSLCKQTDEEKQQSILQYESQVRERQDKIEKLETQFEAISSAKSTLETSASDLNKQIEALTLRVSELVAVVEIKDEVLLEANNSVGIHQEEIAKLTSTIEEQEKRIEAYVEKENEDAANMKTELADQEKQVEDLGTKTKSLQAQINVKTKQVKNMEKESKSLKSQLKVRNDKIAKLEEEIQKSNESSNVSVEKIEELTEKLATVDQELAQVKQQNDVDQKEFCATLEHYKIENDRIVAAFEADNKELKSKVEELQACLSEGSNRMSKQMEEREKLIEEQRNELAALQGKLSLLEVCESRNQDLENSISALRTEMEAERTKCTQLKHEYEVKLNQHIFESEDRLRHEMQKAEQQLEMQKAEQQLALAKQQAEEQMRSPHKSKSDDRLVPTTPHLTSAGGNAPVTPQSIIRNSQSKRGKRVLFAGKEINSPMDTTEERRPKTPSLSKSSTVDRPNIRFSPKPDAEVLKKLEDDSPMKKNMRMTPKSSSKLNAFKSSNVDSLMDAHFSAANSKSPLNRVQKHKMKKSSPGDVSRPSFKNKLKKVMPKVRKSKEQNLSWFDTDDNAFGFE